MFFYKYSQIVYTNNFRAYWRSTLCIYNAYLWDVYMCKLSEYSEV